MKLKYRIISIYLLIFTLFSFYYSEYVMAADIPLPSFYKIDYKPEDEVSKSLPPNVMFLLDTSTAMTFTVDGVMPNMTDGRSLLKRAEMLKDSTYGHGMRPPLFAGVETTRITSGYTARDSNKKVGSADSYSRYGRDLDPSNNVIGSADCYYTSDPERPFLLTFRNRHLAHRDNWIDSTGDLNVPDRSNLARGTVVGGIPTEEEINEALASWNAIKRYVPRKYVKNDDGYWVPNSYRKHVPVDIANQHLVPNDSRMYKMKLALWRITDQSNANMLYRMNIGVAITYQDISSDDNAISVATKNAAQGSVEGEREYYGATKIFKYGNAAPYITGEDVNTDSRDIHENYTDNAYMSQRTKRGVLVELYHSREPGDNLWNALSRSIMYVPFDKFYVMDKFGYIYKTEKLDNFRDYIRGYESYKESINNNDGKKVNFQAKPVKDEFFASSLTLLSTAIYGGRDSSEGGKFPYHKGKRVSNTGYSPTNEPMIQFAVTFRDRAGSTISNDIYLDPSTSLEGLPTGQAIGSVLDFFNPPDTTGANGLDGVKFADESIGFFPVTGSCQSNWLIVFCAGNDVVKDYSPAEAVRRLFNSTRIMRGRRKIGSGWVGQEYEMDSGVRTLVVGFINPNSTEPEVIKVSEDLKEMAQAGDPIYTKEGYYIDNPDAKPEIASDVPSLIRAFNNVLKRINVDRMGSSTVSLPPVIDNITDPSSRVVFGAAYRINNLDQWTGWLGKYVLRGNTSSEQWEANRLMIDNRFNRKLFTYKNDTTSASVVEVNSSVLSGIVSSDSQTFSDWLLDYGYDPKTGDSIDSVGILGDMVNSGITVVGKPKHKDLAKDGLISKRDAIVYVQTNRGVLHALNYMNGYEKWGFIPPNIFQYKLKNMKYDGDGWIRGNGPMDVKSNPMVLLDGMLIARDCENENSPTRTLLTGYLGHGGNGFYTMDITDGGSAPVFEWAIENARHKESGPFYADDYVKRWGKAEASSGNYDYTDLGFTIVPGVYFNPANDERDTIGVLPGGLGYKLGADSQGKAFYFFKPTDGSIIDKIDTSSFGKSNFDAPSNRSLGMGVSPILFHENAKKAIAFYTADSEGNIIKCDMENIKISNWKLKSIFQLRTLGFEYENNVADKPDADLPMAIPRKMILAKARSGHTWLFGGTSDLDAPGSDTLDSRKLTNKEQFIFGLNVKNILEFGEVNIGITPAKAISSINLKTGESYMRNMTYYADNLPVKYGNYGRNYRYSDEVGVNHGMDDYGWILRLRPKFGETDAEYLSADPYLMNDVLYIATFIPYLSNISEEACNDIGVGKLYALDPSTGLSVMRDKPAITLENVKLVGISGNRYTNRLVLSVKELSAGAAGREIFGNFSNAFDISSNRTLFEVGAPGGIPYDPNSNDPEHNFERLLPHIQYWRESFK